MDRLRGRRDIARSRRSCWFRRRWRRWRREVTVLRWRWRMLEFNRSRLELRLLNTSSREDI